MACIANDYHLDLEQHYNIEDQNMPCDEKKNYIIIDLGIELARPTSAGKAHICKGNCSNCPKNQPSINSNPTRKP